MIKQFFGCKSFAVVGASTDRTKFGNKVLRKYIDKGLSVVPVHPKQREIEGVQVKQLSEIASEGEGSVVSIGISIVTPPKITTQVVSQAAALGFKHIWIQPDAESAEAIEMGADKGLNLIYGGPCLLVSLDRGDHLTKDKL